MRMFKAKAIAVIVATGLIYSSNLLAQVNNNRPGGLFGNDNHTSTGMMGRSESTAGGYFTGQGFGSTSSNITGQTFGEDTPLGGGLFLLLAAGASYATIKSRKKQNRKE